MMYSPTFWQPFLKIYPYLLSTSKYHILDVWAEIYYTYVQYLSYSEWHTGELHVAQKHY